MTPDEVRFAAAHMIEKHGSEAVTVAEFTASSRANDDFPQVARKWRQIVAAIKQEFSRSRP